MNMVTPNTPAETQTYGPPDGYAAGLTEQLDLRRLWAMFRRRLVLFAAVAGAILAAAIIFTLVAPRQYTATASVMLNTRQQDVTPGRSVLSDLPKVEGVVDSEVEVLKSRELTERVIQALKLDQDVTFNKALKDGKPKTQADADLQHTKLVDTVQDGLKISRAGLTFVINIDYTAPSPQMAAAIAEKYAEIYLDNQTEAKVDATQQATNLLNSRLKELADQVQKDDAAVQQYKIDHGLLSAGASSLTEQEISNYNIQLSQAKAQVAEDQARLAIARRQMANGSTGDDVGEALASPVIQRLREQRAEVSGVMADLAGRYGPRHPEMLKAKRQLADIDAQIQQEIQRLVSNLQAQAQVSQQRAAAVAASVNGAKGDLVQNNQAAVGLAELQRQADASRALYESYLSRFKDTSNQQGMERPDAEIVTHAKQPPEPSSPKVALNLALGLMLGLGAGLGSVVVAEMIDAGIATAQDVERRLRAPFAGSVPLLSSVVPEKGVDPITYILQKPFSSFTESFRSLRTSLLNARQGEPVKVVAVTSSLPGEGKTTTTICLARTAAQQGSKVVIVDCDLRRPTLGRMLQLNRTVGLIEVISGAATLEEALVTDADSNVSILPIVSANATPEDIFRSGGMQKLIGTLRQQYDFVVLDTPPLLPVSDTRSIAPWADVTLFLVRWRRTPKHAVETALRSLDGTGALVGGVALTQVDMKQQTKVGFGDPAYYYSQYKDYYTS